MREFATTRALAVFTGLPIDDDDPRGENFPGERDWGIYRGSGYGLAGTDESGWLVTFASDRPDLMGNIPGDGYLIAHAIVRNRLSPTSRRLGGGLEVEPEAEGMFGGRCLLLGGPWNADRQDQIWRLARQQEWYESRAGGAKVDVEKLDEWLIWSGYALG